MVGILFQYMKKKKSHRFLLASMVSNEILDFIQTGFFPTNGVLFFSDGFQNFIFVISFQKC